LWKRDTVEGQVHREQMEHTPQFVIEDEDDDNDNDGESSASAAGPSPQPPRKRISTLPSIAERLLSCLIITLCSKGEDPRANLVSVCFQVLCVVLDFQSGSARDVPTSDPLVSAPALKTNAFRHFLAKVVRRVLELVLI